MIAGVVAITFGFEWSTSSIQKGTPRERPSQLPSLLSRPIRQLGMIQNAWLEQSRDARARNHQRDPN
jgi:hypothetical protein